MGGATTAYAYDTNGALPVLLSDGSRKYVYGPQGLAYSVDTANTVAVYHTDGLGSVRALTDGTGTLIQTYQTDAFGVPTGGQGTSGQPFGFTGQQQDGDGLVYLRARYYDPATGRFLSRDSYPGDGTAPLSLNRYTYAENNPGLQTDPSGRCPICLAAVAWGLTDAAPVLMTLGAAVIASPALFSVISAEVADVQQDADTLLSPDASAADKAAAAVDLGFLALSVTPTGSGARPLWTIGKAPSAVLNAFRHYKAHGGDFPDAHNVLEYVRKAQDFMHSPPPTALTRVRANGDVVRFDPTTNYFGVMDASGAVKTFFIPNPTVHGYPTNMDYFLAQ